MPRPTTRDDSSFFQYVRHVPTALVDKVRGRSVMVTLPPEKSGGPPLVLSAQFGRVVKFSLRTRDPVLAKARSGAAEGQISEALQAYLAGPVPLTQRQVVALAGEVYRLFVERFEDNPGTAEMWAATKAFNRAVQEGRIPTAPRLTPETALTNLEAAKDAFGADLTAGVNALTPGAATALEERFGWLADWTLAKHRLVTNEDSRGRLLLEAAKASTDAAWFLKRAADGDYTPDAKAQRFPKPEEAFPPIRPPSKTLGDLFDHWKAEAKPAPSTIQTWRGHVASLVQYLGHNRAGEVTEEDAVAWKDRLVAGGLRSVRRGHLAALKALYRHGVANKLVAHNPFERVKVRDRQQAGETRLPYTTDEVKRILELASTESVPFRRWGLWLLATTGARVGEIAQLWGRSVAEEDGFPVIRIAPAPDGGRLKNAGSERTVPIHPALTAAGFLSFAKAIGDRPLFYAGTGRKSARSRSDDERKHPSKGITNRLGAWVREQGFTDPRKAPSHSFRHWFKTELARAGVSDRIADRIQGHTNRDIAGRYAHADLQAMLDAVSKLPLPLKA